MNRDSNLYIFGYAALMVTVVAILLTSVSMALRPRQVQNIRNDKIMMIISAVGIESTVDDAEQKYNKHIIKELLVDSDGNVLSIYENGELIEGDTRPFEIDLKKELNKEKKNGNGRFPIYVAEVENQKLYITPLRGKGLWGPLWGNIAFEKDFNTVYGANFDHKSETPGLGAEISEPKKEGKEVFSDQFEGKKIFDEDGKFQSIAVVKGGVDNQSQIPKVHGVDAISGGTLTSNGVTEMLETTLSNYVSYIKKNKQL